LICAVGWSLWPSSLGRYDGFARSWPMMIGAACVALGVARAVDRNPAANQRYADWLRNTPWSWPKPLPQGAVLPTFLDAMWLGVLTILFSTDPTIRFDLPPAMALLGYSLGLSAASMKRALHPELYVVAFSLLGAVNFRNMPWLEIPLMIAALMGASFAMRKTLQQFPHWNDPLPRSPLRHSPALRELRNAWPFAQLSPQRLRKPIPPSHAVLIGTLCCALIWTFFPPGMDRTDDSPITLFSPGMSFLSIVLFPFYAGLHGWIVGLLREQFLSYGISAPLTLRGRWQTGLFIIPRHDRKHIVPPLLGLIAAGMTVLLGLLGLDGSAQAGLITAVILSLALGLPPSPERARFTSAGRLIRPTYNEGALIRSPRKETAR